MKSIRFLAAPMLIGVLAGAAVAGAQDMSFGLEETGQSGAPVKPGKPSAQLAEALTAFESKRYEAAAIGFEQVVSGKSKDGRGNRQRAEFLLGQTLYKMRYYQSALNVFDEISAMGPAHLFFGDTLEWLGLLASKLPESSGIIEKVGRYGIGALDEFQRERPQALRPVALLDGATPLRAGVVSSGDRCLPRSRAKLFRSTPMRSSSRGFPSFACVKRAPRSPRFVDVSRRSMLETSKGWTKSACAT